VRVYLRHLSSAVHHKESVASSLFVTSLCFYVTIAFLATMAECVGSNVTFNPTHSLLGCMQTSLVVPLSPSHPVDSFRAGWLSKNKEKIIITVLCHFLYYTCAQMYTLISAGLLTNLYICSFSQGKIVHLQISFLCYCMLIIMSLVVTTSAVNCLERYGC